MRKFLESMNALISRSNTNDSSYIKLLSKVAEKQGEILRLDDLFERILTPKTILKISQKFIFKPMDRIDAAFASKVGKSIVGLGLFGGTIWSYFYLHKLYDRVLDIIEREDIPDEEYNTIYNASLFGLTNYILNGQDYIIDPIVRVTAFLNSPSMIYITTRQIEWLLKTEFISDITKETLFHTLFPIHLFANPVIDRNLIRVLIPLIESEDTAKLMKRLLINIGNLESIQEKAVESLIEVTAEQKVHNSFVEGVIDDSVYEMLTDKSIQESARAAILQLLK